jgi:hypothetical protein
VSTTRGNSPSCSPRATPASPSGSTTFSTSRYVRSRSVHGKVSRAYVYYLYYLYYVYYLYLFVCLYHLLCTPTIYSCYLRLTYSRAARAAHRCAAAAAGRRRRRRRWCYPRCEQLARGGGGGAALRVELGPRQQGRRAALVARVRGAAEPAAHRSGARAAALPDLRRRGPRC